MEIAGQAPEGRLNASFETPGAVSLRIQNPSGKVEIATHSAPKTEVRVSAAGTPRRRDRRAGVHQ